MAAEVVAAGEVVVVEIAGDIAVVAGVVPATGESPGAVAAGFVTAAGAVTAGLVAGLRAGFDTGGGTAGATGLLGGAVTAGGGGGGTWPNEVNAIVTEQRLAISSIFIGLIGKFISCLEFR